MELSDGVWPNSLQAVQVRVARPTDRIDEILEFYCDHLGLPELHRTQGDGYHVAMVGLPGDKYHLEFTSRIDGSPAARPATRICWYFISRLRRGCSRLSAGWLTRDTSRSIWRTHGGPNTVRSHLLTLTIGESC
jgi:hypothetical protein